MITKAPALHVIVVGGGLGGLAGAMAFRRRGFEVTVLEAAAEFQSLGRNARIYT